MKRTVLTLLGLGLLAVVTGCSRSLPGTPTPLPTLIIVPSIMAPLTTPTTAAPTLIVSTPSVSLPTVMADTPIPTPGSTSTPISGILPGVPSGPYSVIHVTAGDVLNVRAGPGVGYPVSGSFSATATNVMRTGSSSTVDNSLWVEVQNPAGGTGWVNADYLTEYVASATFCPDGRVNTLLTNFSAAIQTSNGTTLSSLVSPVHGMTVYLWRYGIPHTFKQSDAKWVFDSTFAHNWGAVPASGLDTTGSFHEKVLPWLQEVFNASYSLTCNSLGTAPQYGYNPWPVEYANVNYYTVYKPGTPGVDLDWRYWLVGVEYVQGQPFIFAVIHFNWEP